MWFIRLLSCASNNGKRLIKTAFFGRPKPATELVMVGWGLRHGRVAGGDAVVGERAMPAWFC
jgi:hypothetical protein